ncbi:MAG: hypothetical protein U0929_17570 [Planctomycetaceae bacterium]
MPSRRWQPRSLLIWTCIGLVLGSGCASMQFPGRIAAREREPEITEQTRQASRARSDEDAESAAGKVDKADKKSPTREKPPAIAGQSKNTSRKIDPATQMLIDSELKDLPADERQQWKNYLASVETAEIPHILQNRAEGIVPPELEPATASTEVASKTASSELASHKLLPKKQTRNKDAQVEGELEAPAPEIELSSGQQEAPVDGAPNSEPRDNTPAIQLALEEDSDEATKPRGDVETASQNQAEPPPSDKNNLRKKWSTNRRGDRSLTDRISNARINPLTPPWGRDPQPTDDKTAKPPYAPKAPVDNSAVTAFNNDPIRTDPKADYWQDELRKLISLMEAEAARPPSDDSPAEKQAYIQRQVYLRMLYLMDAEPEKAQLPISDVQPVDQEFWTSMFWGMSNYFDVEHTGDPGTRAAQTIAQLNSASRQLQSVADLELRNVCFSPQIDGWGLYERFDRDEFEPGQEVLLYGEIRNFSSEATATGFYRTAISSTIEIVRANEEDSLLERNDLGQTEDLCRGQRTDFYNSYRIMIPHHLSPGSYQLRLTVEDKLSNRLATQTIGFVVR